MTTTSRKLDREQQDEHILEVSTVLSGFDPLNQNKSETERQTADVLSDTDECVASLSVLTGISNVSTTRPSRSNRPLLRQKSTSRG